MQGRNTEVLGSRHYVVDVSGSLWKRHVDQLLSRPLGVVTSTNDSVTDRYLRCLLIWIRQGRLTFLRFQMNFL